MTRGAARVRRVIRFMLTAPAAGYLIAAVFVIVGVVLVVTDYTINDEGLLTHYWASWLRRDFAPVFFFQKAKPVLCVLYAAVSAGGPRATLIAHVVVAATAIVMLAATARALGYRLANLPALMVAASPVYFYGAAAGLSNTDGVVGIVLALYLLSVRRLPLAAGLVIGLLPWVRFELAIFAAVMAAYALLTERQRTMLLGMAVFPLAYVAAGAFYHHDVLWFQHFPPSSPSDPGNPMWHSQPIGLRYLLEPVVAVTPAAVMAVALPLKRLRRVEYALLAYAVLTALAMNVLPILQIGYFGTSPRYSLHLLPALALLVGRAAESWWEGERPGLWLLLATALVALWVATRQLDPRAVALLVAVYALVLGAVWLRAGTLAVALVAGLVLAGPLMPLRTELGRPKYLDPMFAWLNAHPDQRAMPIYTNAQLLAPYLAHRLPGADVHYIMGADLMREKGFLIDAENGQVARLEKLADAEFFAKVMVTPFTPDDLPAKALVILRVDDPRLPLVLPPETWAPRLHVLAETRDYKVAQLLPAAPAPGSFRD